jgi:hypothetical protein
MQENFIIPKSNDPNPKPAKSVGSSRIISGPTRFCMLPSIQLDAQTRAHAVEVEDISCHRNLTAKLKTAQIPVAK